MVIAVGINPESADLMLVVDAARLCRDRAIKERGGNFSELQRVAVKANNDTVGVAGAIGPESGGLIEVIDAEKVLVASASPRSSRPNSACSALERTHC